MKKLLSIAIIAIILAACSSDKYNCTPDPDTRQSEEGYVCVHLGEPGLADVLYSGGPLSRTDAGTQIEQKVRTVDIFMFESESPHKLTHTRFDFTNSNPGDYRTEPIKTKKTAQYIFAGVNLPDATLNYIKNTGLAAFNYKPYEMSVASLTASDGFVMFNSAYPALTTSDKMYDDQAGAASGTPVSIKVSRVVAKVSVKKSADFELLGGGAISDLKYSWRNINRSGYLVQKIESGLIKDHNWDAYTASDFLTGGDELTVGESTQQITAYAYTTENSFKYNPADIKLGQVTYLNINGVYTPNKIVRYAGGITDPAQIADFEQVDNPAAVDKTFWTVRLADYSVLYFTDEQQAQKFVDLAEAGAPGMPSLASGFDLSANKYENGISHFRLFVNTSASGVRQPYGVYRNQYYRVTLKSLEGPGSASDTFDPNEQIKPDAWVEALVEIEDWDVVDETAEV